MKTKNFALTIIVSNRKTNRQIVVADIIRIEARGNDIALHLKVGQPCLDSRTLKGFLKLLNPDLFFLVHRSHIVNRNFIDEWNNGQGGELKLLDGSRIPIAVRGKSKFVKWVKQK